MRLQFLGANRQVTGSRSLLEAGGLRILIDCGMFQERAFQARNWETSPIAPGSIDFLLLTHAHLDHCGLVPRLVEAGFKGPIITVEPTVDLAQIILLDAARIQEEDAAYKKRRHKKEGRRARHPEVPLYTVHDAQQVLPLFRGVPYGEAVKLNEKVSVRFHDAGHILGSAILQVQVQENGISRRVLFSGDLGQWDKPLIGDPTLVEGGDFVVLESTYGDRNHPQTKDILTQLSDLVNDTARRGGNVVIPTFAVERAQELMYHFSELVHAGRIPDLPIFLDSPMAVDVTEVFRGYRRYMDAPTQRLFTEGRPPLRFPGLHLSRTADQSKAINAAPGTNIIMSASGMCTGGRIKHHLRRNISRPESTIVFVGYQAVGTLGREILEGNPAVRIHGRNYDVRAKTARIYGLSAHGDRDDLLRWLGHFSHIPKHVFLNHGEQHVAMALRGSIKDKLGWPVSVPDYQQEVELG